MSSIQVIKGLKSNVSDIKLHKTVSDDDLSKINNYFEVVSDNKPARVFIDLDGHLDEEQLKNYDALQSNILKKLKRLEDVSIMSSSSQESNKLSYRITYINEYCSNMTDLKTVIKKKKFKEIKRHLKKYIPVVCGDNEPNSLNIDMSVYRSNGKMRCVNSWKTDDDKTRINKLEVGSIKDTFIHYIPDDCTCWNIVQETKEEPKEEPKSDVLSNIKKMALKIKKFDNYNEWLQLCFIIYNESNGSQQGKETFIEICRSVCSNFNEEECNKKWYSTQSTKDKKLTVATLYNKFYLMFPEERKSTNKDNKFNNPEYLKQKEKFEKRIFKLDTPFSYVKMNGNNSLEFLEEVKLKQWAKGEFEKIVGDDDKEINFTDVWIEDSKKLLKNEIVFDPDPNNDNSKNYNCFKGFDYDEEMEPVVEDNSKFLQLLKKLTVEKNVYEYFKQWIAHIIQYPYKKTNSAIVLYSETKGVGKNCIVECINRLLKGYTAKVESIEDITRNFNAHLCNKLFITGDEICAKAKKVSDKLKEIITRTSQNLEKKGKDVIALNDFSNWLFTSNNFDAFKVESGDRRLEMIHCCEDKLSTTDSKAFFEEINNPTEINKLFNFFKNVKFSYNIGVDAPPMTEYKKVLEYNNKAGYLQALFKEPYKFVNNSFTSTELLKMTNEYSKQNYLAQTTDATTFGMVVNVMFKNYKKRGDTVSKFNFKKVNLNQFNEILYKYDSEYWRYINHYDEIEEPNFNVIIEKELKTNDLDA